MTTKIRFLPLIIAVLCISAFAQQPRSLKRASWELGSKISLSAILAASDAPQGMVDRHFADANVQAKALGIKLPPLPARSTNKIANKADALYYILNTTGKPIMQILTSDLGREHSAIFEIGLKTNVLLLLYAPGDDATKAIVNVMDRQASVKTLDVLTAEVRKTIARGATFDEVKKAVMDLHNVAPPFIAVNEFQDDGERFYASKEFPRSAAAFTAAIQLDPAGPELYFLRARTYVQLDRNLEAIADYTKVLQLKDKAPSVRRNLPSVYHNRGLCYGLIGKAPLAIADLTEAIRLDPGYASAFKIRGLVYKKMGNARLAAADLKQAELLQPGITGTQ